MRLYDKDYMTRYRVQSVLLIVSIIISIYSICTANFVFASEDNIDVFVLMYHNVVPSDTTSRKYEIRVSDLQKDIEYIRNKHIRVISPHDLYLYKEGKIDLPKKCVMLTFDDGYYSYVRYLLPLLSRYDINAVVNVVGEYTKYNKNNPNTSKRYTYLDYDDIKTLYDSGRVTIGLHSYKMHHIKGGVQGVGQRKGEADADYRLRLLEDTNRLIEALKKIGITSDIYAYPYGSYSRCSDKVLSEVGIRMTFSCNEGINHLRRDSSLYLLKRYNRDGTLDSLTSLSRFFV